MSKEATLQSHLNCFFGYLRIVVQQAKDLIKGNLVLICIFHNVFVVQKLYVKSFHKSASHTQRRDILELVLKESLHFGYSFVV